MKKNNRKGFALLTIIFIMLVLSVLVVGIVALFFSGANIFVKDYSSDKAFYIAEAGKAYAMKRLGSDTDWSSAEGFPLTNDFAGGQFSCSLEGATTHEAWLISVGTITREGTTYLRGIKGKIIRSSSGLGEFGMFAEGDITIGDNAEINGDLSATGTITIGDGGSVSGEVNENADPPTDPPTVDSTYYDMMIATAE